MASRLAGGRPLWVGDRDIVTIEHAAGVQRAPPNAQLAVVPGASHGLPMETPELVSRPVAIFLSESRDSAAADGVTSKSDE